MSASLQKRSTAINPVIRTMAVGPEIAAAWLRTNHLNRRLREKKIKRYAADMADGKWRESFVPILFGKSGRLIDGQHRLHAVVAAGATLNFLIVEGVDDNVFEVLDDGAPRQFADVLTIEGYEGWLARTGAAAAQIALAITSGVVPMNLQYPNNALRQFVLDNPELMTSVSFMAGLPRKGVPISHSVGAALHFFMVQKDADLAESFFRGIYAGEGLRAGTLLLEFRNRLIARAMGSTGAKGTRKDSMAAIIRVWNSLRIGRPIKHLGNAFRNDAFPEIK